MQRGLAFAIFYAHFIRLTCKRFTALDTLIIIGLPSPERAKLEELFARSGWRCLIADDAQQALTFESLSKVKVAIVSGKLPVNELEELLRVARGAGVVLYEVAEVSENLFSEVSDRLISVIDTNAPAWVVNFSIRRAVEASQRQIPTSGTALVEQSYRNLFHASVELNTIESLQDLLNLLCKEIAMHTCHNRAVIVLSDARFRIQHAGAYARDTVTIPNLSSIRGQPLTPILPDRSWSEVGKGYIETTRDVSPHLPTSQPLVIPLERSDGTVAGFLTLDQALSDAPPLAELSEPIALLLAPRRACN